LQEVLLIKLIKNKNRPFPAPREMIWSFQYSTQRFFGAFVIVILKDSTYILCGQALFWTWVFPCLAGAAKYFAKKVFFS